VFFRQSIVQQSQRFYLFSGTCLEWRLNAVRHQGLQAAELPPVLEFRRVVENFKKIGFMIALEKHGHPISASLDEEV